MTGIGIDTGGTCTDIVVYDFERAEILAAGKTATTREDLKIGILRALDQIDRSLLEQASVLALSTTLATNACLENKGGRARELMIGLGRDTMMELKEVYDRYGFRELNDIVCMEGKPENLFSHPEEPDWDSLKKHAKDWFGLCQAVGVTQIYPDANGARYERTAREIIEKETHLPVTISAELSDDVDMLRRGAGSFLNARLIPVMQEFFRAVKAALEERRLPVPIAVMTSDGSLLPEEAAVQEPVTTILSGPAASAVGGRMFAGSSDAVIIDMGGTTTDIALMRNGKPVLDREGIAIGSWRTNIRGILVDTTLLGGDSEIRFENGRLSLSGERVIPLCQLAEKWPGICEKLKDLADSGRTHTRMLHEFYVLQRRPDDRYTEEERALCRALENGPLMAEELAAAAGGSIYTLGTGRLEEEGIVIRSGLTPTDMMVLKGDLSLFSGEASREAVRFVAQSAGKKPEDIPDLIYGLVEEKMYARIVELLLREKHPSDWRSIESGDVLRMIHRSFEDAQDRSSGAHKGPEPGDHADLIGMRFHTDLPLVGVGAPTHVFLPKVAEYLGTRAVLNEYGAVANALGAVSARTTARTAVHVKAAYDGAVPDGFAVMDGDRKISFDKLEPAEAFGEKVARREVEKLARRRGLRGTLKISVTKKKIHSGGLPDVFFETVITAVASA